MLYNDTFLKIFVRSKIENKNVPKLIYCESRHQYCQNKLLATIYWNKLFISSFVPLSKEKYQCSNVNTQINFRKLPVKIIMPKYTGDTFLPRAPSVDWRISLFSCASGSLFHWVHFPSVSCRAVYRCKHQALSGIQRVTLSIVKCQCHCVTQCRFSWLYTHNSCAFYIF